MFIYNFENLEVWKLSVRANKALGLILKKLPVEERYVLADQLRRAGLSISLNIAEGWGRQTKKDFGRFISNAIGSALEVIAGLKIAREFSYIKEDDVKELDDLLKELYFKLLKFASYLRKNSPTF
jgi:four helix bundle protein